MPNGASLEIDDMPASDTQGFSGLSDRINRHEGKVLEGVVLATLLGVGTEIGWGDDESSVARAIRESAQDNGSRAGDQLVGRSLDIQPTLIVRPGWAFRIVVNDKRLTERVDYWLKLDDRLTRELAIDRTLKTPVNFIVHTLQEVNDGLAHGRYFFMEVAKDGVALYSFDDKELHTPKPKTPDEALAMATEYFEEWLPQANAFYGMYRSGVGEGNFKQASFVLHQATESLYHCVLLVCTFYTPHVHNLGFLRTQAERLDMRLVDAWPRETRRDRARFEKLKDAYVKARYSKHYRISEEELGWLGERVEELGRAVQAVCSERIDELKAKGRSG